MGKCVASLCLWVRDLLWQDFIAVESLQLSQWINQTCACLHLHGPILKHASFMYLQRIVVDLTLSVCISARTSCLSVCFHVSVQFQAIPNVSCVSTSVCFPIDSLVCECLFQKQSRKPSVQLLVDYEGDEGLVRLIGHASTTSLMCDMTLWMQLDDVWFHVGDELC